VYACIYPSSSLSSEGGAIGSRIDWNVTLHWSEVVLCFRDDAHPHQKEVLRVTADHLLIDYYNKVIVSPIHPIIIF